MRGHLRYRILAVCASAVLLTSCTSAPEPAPVVSTTTTSTQSAPDPSQLKARLEKALVSADVLGPLGYVSEGPTLRKEYPLVMCPATLTADKNRSAVRAATTWKNAQAFSSLEQLVVSYGQAELAKAAVTEARRALDCGSFVQDGLPVRVVGETSPAAYGADAEFTVCFHANEKVYYCHLLLAKADLLTALTVSTEDQLSAELVLGVAGEEAVRLLGA